MKINTRKGNGVIGFIILIAIIWGASSLFSEDKSKSSVYQASPSYSASAYSSYGDDNNIEDSTNYQEPENPYDEGSGHSAGYEWAEENDVSSCDGNSDSFIEGCEEYLSQQEEYEN